MMRAAPLVQLKLRSFQESPSIFLKAWWATPDGSVPEIMKQMPDLFPVPIAGWVLLGRGHGFPVGATGKVRGTQGSRDCKVPLRYMPMMNVSIPALPVLRASAGMLETDVGISLVSSTISEGLTRQAARVGGPTRLVKGHPREVSSVAHVVRTTEDSGFARRCLLSQGRAPWPRPKPVDDHGTDLSSTHVGSFCALYRSGWVDGPDEERAFMPWDVLAVDCGGALPRDRQCQPMHHFSRDRREPI